MGSHAAFILMTDHELLGRFARLMQARYNSRIYLFGSRARGTANSQSDYDVVVVTDEFAGQRVFHRAPDRYELWRQAGGFGKGLDLHCYTSEEFREEVASLGYLGTASRRGELHEVKLDRVIGSESRSA